MIRVILMSVSLVLMAIPSAVQAQSPVPPAAPKSAHPVHGPHEGELLEIGNEEFHAEVVVDETKKLFAIYVLDAQAKSYVALDAPFLAINMKLANKPVQFKLKAAPQTTDKAGSSSCFQLTSPELIHGLHANGSDPKLSLKIGKKSYVVKVAHDHDHSGHKHATQSQGSGPQKR